MTELARLALRLGIVLKERPEFESGSDDNLIGTYKCLVRRGKNKNKKFVGRHF